jgi:hypothetical protein
MSVFGALFIRVRGRETLELLEIPSTPGLEVRSFGHGQRHREAREKVAVVLSIGHAPRAHEALGRPDALPGFFEIVHRLFQDGIFVGHDRNIRISSVLRSVDYLAFSREHADWELLRKRRRMKGL